MTYHPDQRAQARRDELEAELLRRLFARDAAVWRERVQAQAEIMASEAPKPTPSPVRIPVSLSPYDPLNSILSGGCDMSARKSTAKIARDFLQRVPSAYVFPIRVGQKKPPLIKNDLAMAFNEYGNQVMGKESSRLQLGRLQQKVASDRDGC